MSILNRSKESKHPVDSRNVERPTNWKLLLNVVRNPRENEFDIKMLTDDFTVMSNMYACTGQNMSRHTFKHREMMKIPEKTTEKNPRNHQRLFHVWTNKRRSQNCSVCVFHIYVKERTRYCLGLYSKNIFSNAHPFYQSHLSMAY